MNVCAPLEGGSYLLPPPPPPPVLLPVAETTSSPPTSLLSCLPPPPPPPELSPKDNSAADVAGTSGLPTVNAMPHNDALSREPAVLPKTVCWLLLIPFIKAGVIGWIGAKGGGAIKISLSLSPYPSIDRRSNNFHSLAIPTNLHLRHEVWTALLHLKCLLFLLAIKTEPWGLCYGPVKHSKEHSLRYINHKLLICIHVFDQTLLW